MNDRRPSPPTKLVVGEAHEFKDKPVQVAAIHPETMKSLSLEVGDILVVEGNARHKSVLVCGPAQSLPRNRIELHQLTRANLRVEIGDSVVVLPCNSNQVGKSIRVLTLQDHQETTGGGSEQDVNTYFSKAAQLRLPLHEGNTIIIRNNMRLKVVETNPPGFCTITEATKVDIVPAYWDIGGCKRQIKQIRELVELPLRHPEAFQAIGARSPRGVLLFGPPGTGKTRLVRAVADQADATLVTIDGSEIMSDLAGRDRLREAFQEAESGAPAVLFIDEIDAISLKDNRISVGVDGRVVAQLLALMDGMKERPDVVVIAATSRPNAIDPALRRFGRFDRAIAFGIPDHDGRLEILRIHTKLMKLDDNVNLQSIADETHGYVGADIAALCTEAAMCHIRKKIGLNLTLVPPSVLESLRVDMEDFRSALIAFGPSLRHEIVVETPKVEWSDIGGLDDIVKELRETLLFPIERAKILKEYGMSSSRGVLLHGPQGTGKGLLAKAVASECGMSFISVKVPKLSMCLDELEAGIRDIFDKARAAAPCLVFFDELDFLIRAHGSQHSEDGCSSSRILGQLLAEMVEINSKKNVFIIGATDMLDQIDPAFLRPGRFDRLIHVPLPDEHARLSILKAILHKPSKRNQVSNADLHWVVQKTVGFSGAELMRMRNRALELFIRAEVPQIEEGKEADNVRPPITRKYFDMAIQDTPHSLTSQAPIQNKILSQVGTYPFVFGRSSAGRSEVGDCSSLASVGPSSLTPAYFYC